MHHIGVGMEASNATTEADSDDDYIDDVVVRAALERLQREFDDDASIRAVYCDRWNAPVSTKTDYINIRLADSVNSHGLARIVQDALDTGVVRVSEIRDDRLQFAPTEGGR